MSCPLRLEGIRVLVVAVPKIKKSSRQNLYKMYSDANSNIRCRYCDIICLTDVSDGHDRMVTLDHLIPVSKGGTNAQANLIVCCFACNRDRGDKIKAKKLPSGRIIFY